MPIRPSKWFKGVYVELTPDVIEQAKQFAKDRGEKFRDVVEQALRRHMAYPPPVEQPPTPAPPPVPPPHPFPDTLGAEAEVEPGQAAQTGGKKGRGAGRKGGGRQGAGKK
jgi:hypothetical protein